MKNSLYHSTLLMCCLSYLYAEDTVVKQKRVEPVQVGLKVILDNINAPTVIKTETLPGDRQESIFILTQPGEIWLLRKGKAQKILDISYTNGGPVVPLGNISGSSKQTYDERGLLGIEFHPEFRTNGRFFLYYSTEDHTPKLETSALAPAPNPCDPETQNIQWTDQNKYNHVNVVEEWNYKSIKDIKKVKRFLSIKHPFMNHDSINNLFWSTELQKLLLLTGDGGFRDGPFNLSQNDAFFHGKVIALDINAPAWNTYKAQPIARFDELPIKVRKSLSTLIKGVRNWSGITEFPTEEGSSIKFVGQPGQDTVEAVFAFKKYFKKNKDGKKRPLNFGWRAWEGSWPSTQNIDCKTGKFTLKIGTFLNLTYYQEAVNLNVERQLPYCEYFHLDARPGRPQAVCITGQQVYRGNALKGLKNHLIISDWAQNIGAGFSGGELNTPGFLIRVPIDNKLDRLHDYEMISIAYTFKKPAYFISLGANKKQTRIFLGTYQKAGTVTPHLGTVFELVPAR